MAGFTIPDHDVATGPNASDGKKIAARWYSTDIAILVAALARTGVRSGCAVSPQGSPDMTVAVAAGFIEAGGIRIEVTAGNLTVGTADGSNPRVDLITVSASGTKTITAGTAAADPKAPNLPSGHIGLAYVLVPTSATTIVADDIVDKRALLSPPPRSVADKINLYQNYR